MSDIYMRILLSAQDTASQVIRGVTSALGGAGLAGVVVATAAAVGALAIGIGVEAVKAAADFQTGLTVLSTGAGELQSNLQLVGNGIKQISIDTATSTDQLLKGAFMVESAGYHGADALNVLKVAAQGARLENADLGQTANALTNILHDYGMKSTQAAEAMNALITTEASGKMHMQDLTTTLGRVLPLAAALGISFPQVGGAIATMTNSGMTARNAANNLAFALRALSAPSHVAQTAMKELGIHAQDLKDLLSSPGGLPQAISYIEDRIGRKFPAGSVEAVTAFKALMGGATGYNVALMLGGKHMDEYRKNVQNISAAMQNGRAGVMGWSQVQGTFNFKMGQAKEALHVLLIDIGQQLLPVLTGLVAKIAPILMQFDTWLIKSGTLKAGIGFVVTAISNLVTIGGHAVSFFQQNEAAMDALKVVGIAVAGMLGGLMVFALYTMASAAWTAAAGMIALTWPFLLIGAIVALVVAGVILAIKHWGQIVDWLKGVWGAVAGWFGHIFSAIGTTVRNALTGIKDFFGNIFSAIGTTVHNALLGIATFFVQKWDELQSFVRSIPGKIQQALAQLAGILLAPFLWFYNHNYYVKAAVDQIHRWLTDLKNKVGSIFSAIGTFIHDKLVWVQQTVGSIFSAIGTFVHGKLTLIKNTVGDAFSWIGSIIHQKLTEAHTTAVSILNNMASFFFSKLNLIKTTVGDAFSALGSAIHDKLTAAWNWVTNFVSGWPAQAAQWGVNLIKGLIGGITSMVGNLMSTIGGIAHNIAGFLGFHSPPPLGPLHDADTYMPNMMKMLTTGLHASKPALQSALYDLALPISATFSGALPPHAGTAAPGMQAPTTSGPATSVVYNFNISIDTMAGSRREVEHLVDLIEEEMARRFRHQTPGYSSGNVF